MGRGLDRYEDAVRRREEIMKGFQFIDAVRLKLLLRASASMSRSDLDLVLSRAAKRFPVWGLICRPHQALLACSARSACL